MRVALISCTNKKMDKPCKASEMYLPSPRFKLAYEYAKKNSDVVCIISAKYGLIDENQLIDPYNETLNGKSKLERQTWAKGVINKLSQSFDLENDTFVILAGRVYSEFILSAMNNFELPLEGLSIGRWIPKLRELNSQSKCSLLHEIFNSMPRYNWKSIDEIPFNNGIYIMFESGEKLYGKDRIIRIGTHNADGRLKKRLKDHFISQNKDGSILRKNIGLALLHKENDSFEMIWAMDSSKPETRSEILASNQSERIKMIERRVSKYLQNHINFTCIQVDTKDKRLFIEGALITTLNHTADFYSSETWLGLSSPKPEIARSGLWNTQGLDKHELTIEEILDLENNIAKIVVSKSINDKNSQKSETIKKTLTADIREFIRIIITNAQEKGLQFIDLVSGDIHKQMRLSNKMPSVCAAMYQVMAENDVILSTTPSSKSSTIKVRYNTNRM
ncbi:MAG: hypothetical protein GX587_11065 [Bacteroidales bacterium]|nr:hypothetical protein [Bacteroidales bacterium]